MSGRLVNLGLSTLPGLAALGGLVFVAYALVVVHPAVAPDVAFTVGIGLALLAYYGVGVVVPVTTLLASRVLGRVIRSGRTAWLASRHFEACMWIMVGSGTAVAGALGGGMSLFMLVALFARLAGAT